MKKISHFFCQNKLLFINCGLSLAMYHTLMKNGLNMEWNSAIPFLMLCLMQLILIFKYQLQDILSIIFGQLQNLKNVFS